MLHGDLGDSRTLQRPVSQLVAERLPETLKSVALGLALGWSAGFLLAVAIVMSRAWYLDLLGSLLVGVLLCLPAAVLALLFVLAQAPARLLLGLGCLPEDLSLFAKSAGAEFGVASRADRESKRPGQRARAGLAHSANGRAAASGPARSHGQRGVHGCDSHGGFV